MGAEPEWIHVCAGNQEEEIQERQGWKSDEELKKVQRSAQM